MVYKQFCVTIAAGKKRNSVSTSTLFTTARTLPTLPADGTYATEAADVTYRCYLPTARVARALPTDVTYQRYLRCVVLETRHKCGGIYRRIRFIQTKNCSSHFTNSSAPDGVNIINLS